MNRPDGNVLYGIVGVLSLFLLISALGGGIWNQGGHWIGQWQHRMFDTLCHQMPERSFWFGGQPAAVCSRCLGIYGGLVTGFMLAPLLTFRFRLKRLELIWLLIGAAGINLIDVFGNMLGFWQNTLASRFGLGWVLGITVLLLLGWGLLKNVKQQKGITHGTVGTV